MIKNYFKIAVRNLWKNKAFSALNIVGLASGLAVCLLIVLYVVDELSYDKYNTKAGRIYRLDADIYFNNTQANFATSPDPLAPTLKRENPAVEEMVRIGSQSDILVKKGNQQVPDHNCGYVDSTFFKVFTIPLISGNPTTALSEPNSIVIDETTAKKYFNTLDVMGKTLFVDNSTNCKITGVMREIPRQSHFHFHFLRPRGKGDNSWLSNNSRSYILVKTGVSQVEMQGIVNKTVDKYIGRELEAQIHSSLADLQRSGSHFIYHLMPLKDIHLYSNKSYEIEANGNGVYVYIFSVIAAFILLIACVNFMNLSTARSANRAKEVGIRKVVGSLRIQLIAQFLTESMLISFFSLVLAVVLAVALLPLFNQLSGKVMSVATLFSTWLFPVMIALVFITGIVAGSYPAFYLSAFQPQQVLKGKLATGFKSSWLRNGLVVFQFGISIALIIGTLIIYNQLDYIRSREIGYNRQQVLIVHNLYNLGNNIKVFRNEVANISGVSDASAGDLPTSSNFNNDGWSTDASLDPKKIVLMTNFFVDEHYLPTLGMQIKEGRNFSKDFPTDSSGVLLNETAVKVLGFKDPLKETLYVPRFSNGQITGSVAFHVVGVVKDFNFNSMHEKISPLVIQLATNYQTLAVRLKPQQASVIIGNTEKQWKSLAPGQPFNYSFMDADFNNLYTAEQQTGKLFISFAVFAIFIGCLGLFGLVTYAAEQRTKEIGIRKVLGARVGEIVTLLSKDFVKLVLIASGIAFPIAWWAMHKWLQSFAYRIDIGWWVFLVAAFGALAIALLTVSLQAIRAAMANPVNSLHSE
ncbi:MAG TPA: ABC transporter permease [Puia sp.]|nr:ABC transporter permease [Puia sp.]